MTRPVEIPDKAVLQALAQIPRMRRVTIGEMREALVAALPYLAPAAARHTFEEINPGQWLCKDCGAEQDADGNETVRPVTSYCSAAPAAKCTCTPYMEPHPEMPYDEPSLEPDPDCPVHFPAAHPAAPGGPYTEQETTN